VEWNHSINLIGISETDRIINELILDSIIAVPFVPEKGRVIDLGSGAGLPGIVIKILHPSLEITLIESNRKKISFLKQIIRELNLININVLNTRVENAREQFIKSCDIITSRAMTGLSNIIELCYDFLTDKGIIIGFLGSNALEELKKSHTAMVTYSLAIDNSVDYELPGKKNKRTIVILKKIRSDGYLI
jgi:16S rRNA (guanine527-N7)-methyltransferase